MMVVVVVVVVVGSGRPGFDFQQELRIFLFTAMSIQTLGSTQPPFQWIRG